VEGGRKIYASFINNKLADKCYFFTSGKIIGEEGVDSIGKLGIDNIEESVKLEELTVQKLKNDFLFNGKINDYTEHILKLTEELRNRCSQG
jgi:diaminohydroxyphosphoribosylaminopyrimidine deaminase/5-amino-6-(5-phosphoribosylamino)uracil reductase